MLKSLLKKQFSEIFKSYFVNQKTGKARSKGSIIAFFVLFVFIMVCLASVFFGVGLLLSDVLKISGYEWLYFAIMSMIAVALGIFGSVFNTYASVYLAKDNELLLSMPIPIKTLLMSRLSGVAGLSLLYSSVVTIPMILIYCIFGKFNLLALVFQILSVLLIALFVSVLSCLLGFVVAIISSKLKNKSIITVFVSLAFLAGYYFVCFSINDIVRSIVENSESFGNNIKLWGNFLYQIGMACNGDIKAMLIFTVVTVALAVLCFMILSKTFSRIVTLNKGEKKKVYVKNEKKQSSVQTALLKKELKRFTSSATYMLNCGLGIILMPVVAVIIFIKREALTALISGLSASYPVTEKLVPIIVVAALCIGASMCTISTPSVSLEGKNIWIYKSLPIDTYSILRAKINLHIYIVGLPAIISAVIIAYSLKLDYSKIIYIAVISFLYVSLSALFGMVLGVSKANLNWVSETTPIKQSMAVLLDMLLCFVIPVTLVALAYLLRNFVTADSFLIFVIVAFVISSRYLDRWIRTKGTVAFENL